MKNLHFHNNLLTSIVLIIFIIAYYISVSLIINGDLFKLSQTPYYNHLLEAFSKNRFDLDPIHGGFDLSNFNGKWYMYWGLSPSLFILPFYLIWGIKSSDILYTLLAGIVNVVLFFKIIEIVDRYFHLNKATFIKCFIVINFVLISPHFYLSLAGRIWHTNQIIAITYMLLFLFFYFKYLENLEKLKFLIISLIFFSLSWSARSTLITHTILLIYPLAIIFRAKGKKLFIKSTATILLISLSSVMIFFTYNYLRFNNLLETGLTYQQSAARFRESTSLSNFFSINNVPHNFYYYFLNPLTFGSKSPFIKFDPEGNSVFLVYPILIVLLMSLFKKRAIDIRLKYFLLICFALLTTNLLALMLFFGTGWTQFGNRYFLDVIPLLFILATIYITRVSPILAVFLLTYGTVINFLGALNFYHHF